MSKISFILIGIIILFLMIFASFFPVKIKEVPVACTMEAKQCPDGSYVGRQGPQCEFAECPTVKDETVAKLNQKILNNEVYITPLEVIEDSRCPIDVTCIWAGQVRLKTKLESASRTEEVTMTLGTPVIFAGKSISLVNTVPAKNSKVKVELSDYSFDFLVK